MKHLIQQVKKKGVSLSIAALALSAFISGGMITLDSTDVVQAQSGNFEPPSNEGETNNLRNDPGQLPTDKLNLPQNTSLIDAVFNVVNVILGILGILLVLWLLYGGIRYAFAGGNSDAVDEAKNVIFNAIIGIIIIALVWALSNFLVGFLSSSGPIAS